MTFANASHAKSQGKDERLQVAAIEAREDIKPLEELREALISAGYVDFVSSFHRPPRHIKELQAYVSLELSPELATLVSVFYCCAAVDRFVLEAALPSGVIDELIAKGVLVSDTLTAKISTACLRLFFREGVLLFAEIERPEQTLYFGEDSIGLMRRLIVPKQGVGLDLCCGPGAQSLTIAQRCKSVIGVDLNPMTVGLAELNAQLNFLAEKTSFVCGDLWEALPDSLRFDFICANPPLVPSAENFSYPLVGDGGDDGMKITRRILDKLPDRLTSRGSAMMLGVTVSDGISPLCIGELDQYARSTGLGIRFTIIRHFPIERGEAWFTLMTNTYSHYIEASLEEVEQQFLQSMKSLRATHMVTYFITVSPTFSGTWVIDLDALGTNRLWDIGRENNLTKLALPIV